MNTLKPCDYCEQMPDDEDDADSFTLLPDDSRVCMACIAEAAHRMSDE